MIRIRGKGITYGEVWFDEELKAPCPDILLCRQRPNPWPGSRYMDFHTLLIDLSQNEEELLGATEKTTRYQIQRAATKDKAEFRFLDSPTPSLDEFCQFYDRFATEKGVKKAYRNWLKEATARNCLILTCARREGQALVWHAYFARGSRARLLYTASLFRGEDSNIRNMIGRLNRWLHWRDILEFKSRGYRWYDFGGIFAGESSMEAEGINRFKMGFGGVKRRDFNCTIALTRKGRIYLLLLRLRDRMHGSKRAREIAG